MTPTVPSADKSRITQLISAAMPQKLSPLIGPTVLLAFLTLVAFAARPLTPIDETRYVSVAWEMMQKSEYLVPIKNGAPYSHKPPLLFWLIGLGWSIFGISEWWPRLISPLFSLASLAYTLAIARRLWPNDLAVGKRALWILAGSLLWTLFSTSTMFDVMLTLFVLAGVHGLLLVMAGKPRYGWAEFALATGFGLLAKGPMVLLNLLPIAFFAPWWAPGLAWRKWFGSLMLALLAGGSLALAWAIPAAFSGGEEYARMILWDQMAHRAVDSFAHKRPLWWYLPLLPLIFFPWLFWLPIWRGLFTLRAMSRDHGLRLLAVWLGGTFLIFSFISGKQAHYLVPLSPAFALFAGRIVAAVPLRRCAILAGGAGLLYALLQGAAAPYLWRHYDITPIANEIRKLQERGIPLANVGAYHAQYHFAGRLRRPLDEIDASPHAIATWFARHPEGVIIHYPNAPQTDARFAQPYLQKNVVLLDEMQARRAGLLSQ